MDRKQYNFIELPASKSIGARFLVASYFSGSLPAEPYFEDNDDLMVLQQALLALYSDEEPIDFGESPIDVNSSGTAFRFVTAVCASTPDADFVITGTPRLCSRPMQPLLDVLTQAGAEITPQGPESLGPYRINGKKLEGGEFSIRGDISSQFISALMLVAPSWKNGIKLNFTTPVVSRPYIEMTASLLRGFGIDLHITDKYVLIKNGTYNVPDNFRVETDWSAAAFFYEAVALGCGEICLMDLLPPGTSLQGDSRITEMYREIGVSSSFNSEGTVLKITESSNPDFVNLDFSDNPDILLPYALACLCRGIRFHFSGVKNLRFKESDRIETLRSESLKLGFELSTGDDYIDWDGRIGSPQQNIIIDPHDDHRVAMAFAMVALKTGSITIENPQCVEKSFARFWDQIPHLGLSCLLKENKMVVTKRI